MNIRENIYGKIREEKPYAEHFDDASHLYRDLGFDSLAFAKLLYDVEEEFGITIGISEMQSCLVVGDLLSVIAEKTSMEGAES